VKITEPLHSPDGKKRGGADAASFGRPPVMHDVQASITLVKNQKMTIQFTAQWERSCVFSSQNFRLAKTHWNYRSFSGETNTHIAISPEKAPGIFRFALFSCKLFTLVLLSIGYLN
jgi:hypothetical protein